MGAKRPTFGLRQLEFSHFWPEFCPEDEIFGFLVKIYDEKCKIWGKKPTVKIPEPIDASSETNVSESVSVCRRADANIRQKKRNEIADFLGDSPILSFFFPLFAKVSESNDLDSAAFENAIAKRHQNDQKKNSLRQSSVGKVGGRPAGRPSSEKKAAERK